MTDLLGYKEVHDHGYVALERMMGDELSIVNSARVSFDQASQELTDGDRGLINFLMRERHATPFESVVFSFEVKAPLFIAREWVRHRIGCLTGDSKVTFVNKHGSKAYTKTVEELWALWSVGEKQGLALSEERVEKILRLRAEGKTLEEVSEIVGCSTSAVTCYLKRGRPKKYRSSRGRLKNMRIRVLNEDTGEFTYSHIEEVFFKGTQPVYRVTCEDGYVLKATKNHQVYTDTGWLPLGQAIDSGRSLMANGTRTTNATHQNKEWLEARRKEGLSVQEIADAAECSYHTIRKWLKIHGLQFSSEERAFPKGHKPWNAGTTYKLDLSDDQRKRRRHVAVKNARRGSDSNFWRGGTTPERASIGRWTTQVAKSVHALNNFSCVECGSKKDLQTHHIVPVSRDITLAREFSNLITVCKECHDKIHSTFTSETEFLENYKDRLGSVELEDVSVPPPWRLAPKPVKIVSVEYLGEQPTFDLCVRGPHHNFVADGLIVHNSFNEWSARYSEIDEEFYVPGKDYVREQHGKPGAYYFEPIKDPTVVDATQYHIERAQKEAFRTYHNLLRAGVAKEVARTVLPVGMYTKFKWGVNLRALLNFLSLRAHPHAQREIQDFAGAVEALVVERIPFVMDKWQEHGRAPI